MALRVERRRDHALTAKHRGRAEPRGKEIHVFHAVEQRQYCRVRADRGRKRIHRRLEVVCFAAQQDEIERRAQVLRQNRRRLRDVGVALGAADDEPGLGQLFGAARPHQKRDVAAGFLEPAAEITAERAGADHQNTHRAILSRSDYWLAAPGRRGTRRLPVKTCTTSSFWFTVVLRTRIMPRSGRDFDGRTSSTSLRTCNSSPGRTARGQLSSSKPTPKIPPAG